MSFFGALFKPFKKLVKKIGKGIKKVAKKIGKAVGKLGIVGQIGMMFLMPYAAGALGSFFGASGALSSWGATLLKSGGMASKALGHTLNAINTVGTMAGKVYTGVTNTISSAFDVVTGKGTVAQVGKSAKSIFTGPADTFRSALNPNVDLAGNLQGAAKEAFTKTTTDMGIKDATKNIFTKDQNIFEKGLDDFMETQRINSIDVADYQVGAGGKDIFEIPAITPEKSLLSVDRKIKTVFNTPKDVVKETLDSNTNVVTDFLGDQIKAGVTEAKERLGTEIQNVITAPVDAITGKASEIAKVKTLEMLGIEEPVQGAEHGTYNPTPLLAGTDSGIDFTNSYVVDSFAKQGNNHLAYGIANRGYVGNLFDPQNNPTANDFMSQYYVGANVNRQLGVA